MFRTRSFEHVAAVVGVVLCCFAWVATFLVLFGNVPPVFNQGLRTDLILNIGILVVLPVIAGILIASFFFSWATALRRPLLLFFTVAGSLELLLFTFDKTIISVKNSMLPEASYTLRVNDGSIYLDQPKPMSPFGFRTPRVEPKDVAHRVLLLGNSYVVGSGSTFATNYPQVLERDLDQANPGRGTTVFSAGVNGYGVLEERYLYQYLAQQGYHIDTVILNFYLGGDQTNDIRGTTRTAIAGRAQRLHKSLFLRYFYPLNTYLFRFAIYLQVAFDQNWHPDDAPNTKGVEDATCPKSPAFEAFSLERSRYNYDSGAQQRIDMDYVHEAVDALAQEAHKNGAKFAVILLPDYNAALAANRNRFGNEKMDWNWIRQNMAESAAGKYPLLDLSDTFEGRPDLFRCNDTHWNDEGNLLGAHTVASFLTKSLVAN